MKILHVVTKADVGGAQTYVLELATAQLHAGHEVRIIAGELGPMASEATRRGLEVELAPALRREVRPWSELGAARRLGELLVERRPDVVHAHSSKAGLYARIGARGAGIPAVYTAHGWPFDSGAGTVQRVISWLGESFASRWWGEVICLTDADAQLARRGRVVPPHRVHVVHNGLPDCGPTELAELAARASDAPVTIVMVARFAKQKAHTELLRSLALVPPGGWRVQLVGDGPMQAVAEESCRDLGLGDRVSFLGARDDVPTLLSAADIALLWSHYEGMPLSLMEGMRAGLACVANDLPGVRVLFGDAGGVVVPFDETRLAAVLTELIGDREQRVALGAAARRRFVEQFSIERNMAGVDAVYTAAITAASRSGRAAR